MQDSPPTISALGRLFELAARSLHASGFSGGLYPAQWTALRYLATAAPSERTSAKLSRFQQIAMGPVTRTIRTLINKGLVMEGPAAGHHRSKQLDLTPEGIRILAQDPLIALEAEFAGLSQQDARILGATLGRIISILHEKGADETGPSLRLDSES